MARNRDRYKLFKTKSDLDVQLDCAAKDSGKQLLYVENPIYAEKSFNKRN